MPTIYIQTDESESLRIWRNFYNPTAIIQLEIDETISDEILSMIPADIDSVQFVYNRDTYLSRYHELGYDDSSINTTFINVPLHFTCSAEALGKCNLKSIIFGGNVDEIDDSIFQYCTVLERIWFGGSTKPVFDYAPNLLKCPLISLGIMGWGTVNCGKDLLKLNNSIETQCIL
jgi:hypothetical protein